MLDVVVGVVRSSDGRSVTLKHKSGKEIVLNVGVELLVLEGSARTLWDGFSFENEARSPEGQPPIIFKNEYEAIRNVARPVFTVISSALDSGIVTTSERLHWFKDGSVGKVTRAS